LPVFLPDATRGSVRGVDASDLRACGVEALQMNVFHLMQRPGSSTVRALGGLHRLSGWWGPIATDSGGFQVYSLIRQNPSLGQLTERGMMFRPDGARRINLTPEKSIQLQMAYGADLLICLDDCTHASASATVQREAVRRTVAWAERCKAEFDRQIEHRRLGAERPSLFAVVQGGAESSLRRECAEELQAIGFDGYGLGGWPLDSSGRLMTEVIGLVRDLIPASVPMHALGIGHPSSVVTCARLGYGLFDSTMPTRDARHGRLYAFEDGPEESGLGEGFFHYVYISDLRHVKARSPVSGFCDCLTCVNYSRAYLHHLYKVGDPLYFRLSTIHNLRFMVHLISRLRQLLPC
jgi:queuine tRNA-ribosyltransferase